MVPGGYRPPTYNQKIHSITNGTLILPPPPPMGEQMSATYIPQGDTYGEGVGIPGLGMRDDDLITPIDELVTGSTLYPPSQNRIASTASTATSGSGIPPELAAQWPLEKVLKWLLVQGFSKDWQETFRALNLHGMTFLELGCARVGRGNFGLMHQRVYPLLAQKCTTSGTGWDQPREREEGRRMRRLVRNIVNGITNDGSRPSGHPKKDSFSTSMPLSAGPDSADSPNVSPQRHGGMSESLVNAHAGFKRRHPSRRLAPASATTDLPQPQELRPCPSKETRTLATTDPC